MKLSTLPIRIPRTLLGPGRLSPVAKLALVLEIGIAYIDLRRRMSRGDIRATVSHARRGLIEPTPGPAGPSLGSRRDAVRLARAVDNVLGLLPTDSRCLIQALVLTRLLAVRGICGSVVIGAHLRGEFEAHAWVELGGVPVQPPGEFINSILLRV